MRGIKGMGLAMLLMLSITPALSAQESATLLEKAIYTEETLGNLNDAINLYKQIINAGDTSRDTGALALYRLGLCYRKTGREVDALTTFSALAQLYPERRDLIAKTLILTLRPAPWADGEIMRLTQKRIGSQSMAGSDMYATYSAESSEVGGKPAWDLRYFIGTSRFPIYYTITTTDAGTMIPITNRTLSNRTDLEARYSADRIEVLNLRDSTQPAKQIPSKGMVYDAWEILSLLRCLPLQEGFQSTIPAFESSSGSFASARLSVVAKETITVPAGSFETYKVVMTSDNNVPADQIFWISADSHAYLVKAHINGTNEFELKAVEVVGKNQLVRVESSELGISLSTPRQWYISLVAQPPISVISASPSGLYQFLMLAAPELESSLYVAVSNRNPSTAADGRGVFYFNGEQKNAIRSQTRESVSIAGLAGERYITDSLDSTSGEPIVEYVCTLVSQSKTYLFRFQTGKNNFDRLRPVFDAILSSLRVQ